MIKVFVGGSRSASRLNPQVRKRLDNIIEKGFPIVIGDANGADKAIQKYLHSKHYQNVEVFCSNGLCRNNVGWWQTHNVPVASYERNAQFYSAKDRVMAQEATFGLMMWDGKSVGTLFNVFRLLRLQKIVVIFSIPEERFVEFRTEADWDTFLASCDADLRRKIEQRGKFETADTLAS